MTSHFLSGSQLGASSLNPQNIQGSNDLISIYDHSYDGLPRSLPDHNFFNPPDCYYNTTNSRFYLPTSQLSLSQMEDVDPQASEYNFSSHERYYDLTSSRPGNQKKFSAQSLGDQSTCPRTWPQIYDPKIPGTPCEAEAPPNYCNEPMTASCSTLDEDGSPHDFAFSGRPQYFSQLNISRSPPTESQFTYANPAAIESQPTMGPDLPSSRVSELGEDEIGGESLSGSEERAADEPYAKLIYRALLSAPNHSMVLQEIYQWFKDNTDKGNSGTSGWRNSIRHNLSMNAAFRKTDRRTSGDDTRKTSEWVLEPFAIKDGITPTTRYRVKSNKKVKSETPSRLRIESGRKGGISAGRHKQKSRDENYEPPTTRQDRRQRRKSPNATSRHISPSTPPGVDLETPSPYFVNRSPFSFNGVDVKGFYDDGPVFYSSEISQYGEPQAYNMWPHFSQY